MPNRPEIEEIAKLIELARDGDVTGTDALLAAYRPYLKLIARQQLPRFLARRIDESDIVQQALIDAVRGLPEFRGQSEPELTAWLIRLLERSVLQGIRGNTTAKRDVRLEHEEGNSACVIWHTLAIDDSSPTVSILRGEAALQLAWAIENLPSDQRDAVRLRYLSQESLKEIAVQMDKTVGAVAGLIRRGIDALHETLPDRLHQLS